MSLNKSFFLRCFFSLALFSSSSWVLAAEDVVIHVNGNSSENIVISTGAVITFNSEGIKIPSENKKFAFADITTLGFSLRKEGITQPDENTGGTIPGGNTIINIVYPDPSYPSPKVIGEVVKETYDISQATISINSSYTYTGKEIVPQLTIRYKTSSLKEGSDYECTYNDNKNVGTATVTITGKGNYIGSVTKTFEITEAPIDDADVTLDNVTEYIYSGEAIRPQFTIRYSGTHLVLNTDYTFEYSNNINAGTASIKFSGKGNFKGTKTVPFTISPISIDGAQVTLDKTDFECTGDSIKPNASVMFKGVQLDANKDYIVIYEKNVLPGTAYVTIQGIGNYQGKITIPFNIINPYTITLMVDSMVVEPRIQTNNNTVQAVYDGYYQYTNSFVINDFEASVGDTVTLVLRPVEFCEAIVTMNNEELKKQHVRNDIYAYKFVRPFANVVINLHFEVDSVAMGISVMQERTVQFCIYDTRGQMLDSGEACSHMDVMDRVKHLPSGFYIIKENNKTFKVYRK